MIMMAESDDVEEEIPEELTHDVRDDSGAVHEEKSYFSNEKADSTLHRWNTNKAMEMSSSSGMFVEPQIHTPSPVSSKKPHTPSTRRRVIRPRSADKLPTKKGSYLTPPVDGYRTRKRSVSDVKPRDAKHEKRNVETPGKLHWQKGGLIGQGSFGRVYLGLNIDSGEFIAVKEITFAGTPAKVKEQLVVIQREIRFLRELNHPNIVRYFGCDRVDTTLNIFLEHVPGGSLVHCLEQFKRFDENVIRVYTKQLLEGLSYLHSHRIVHRDIKAANVLLDSTSGTIKLSDFGTSKQIRGLLTLSKENFSFTGTPSHMAPEVIVQKGHGRAADIWSMGCTVLEMASGQTPWGRFENPIVALVHISQAQGGPTIPDSLSPELKDFLHRCFFREPQKRDTVRQLLRHPFILGEKCIKDEETVDVDETQYNSPSSGEIDDAFNPIVEPVDVEEQGSKVEVAKRIISLYGGEETAESVSSGSADTKEAMISTKESNVETIQDFMHTYHRKVDVEAARCLLKDPPATISAITPPRVASSDTRRPLFTYQARPGSERQPRRKYDRVEARENRNNQGFLARVSPRLTRRETVDGPSSTRHHPRMSRDQSHDDTVGVSPFGEYVRRREEMYMHDDVEERQEQKRRFEEEQRGQLGSEIMAQIAEQYERKEQDRSKQRSAGGSHRTRSRPSLGSHPTRLKSAEKRK